MRESKIDEQRPPAETLEQRVAQLETELQETREFLKKLAIVLEASVGADPDRDGRDG